MDSNFQFRDASPPTMAWTPSFDDGRRLPRGGATPPLVCCVEADERADNAPRRRPNPDEASKALPISRGTESSNPFPSSGESVANSIWAKAASPVRSRESTGNEAAAGANCERS